MAKLLNCFLAFLIAAFTACSDLPLTQSSAQKPDAATEEWIKEVAASLPADEPLRNLIERGYRGNGIHEYWMDGMKKEGVKEVVVDVKGVWYRFGGFRPGRVARIVYRWDYSRPDSQIVDDVKLESLEKNGLQKELQAVAIKKSKRAIWMRIDSNPWSQAGYTKVCLTDNEWLPCGGWRIDRPAFSAFDEEQYPLYSAAIFPDLVSLSKLLSTGHFSQTDLNTALSGALTSSSANTKVVTLLLKAGADVNARRRDGSTVLMEAASGLRLTNVKLLLALGADPNLKNERGETALSWIEGRISSEKDSLPDYAMEIVRLLKEAGAKKLEEDSRKTGSISHCPFVTSVHT